MIFKMAAGVIILQSLKFVAFDRVYSRMSPHHTNSFSLKNRTTRCRAMAKNCVFQYGVRQAGSGNMNFKQIRFIVVTSHSLIQCAN